MEIIYFELAQCGSPMLCWRSFWQKVGWDVASNLQFIIILLLMELMDNSLWPSKQYFAFIYCKKNQATISDLNITKHQAYTFLSCVSKEWLIK